MFLAGRAAEEVILGIMTDGAGGGPGSDLHRATDVAAPVEAPLGLGQGFSFTNVQTFKELETLRRSIRFCEDASNGCSSAKWSEQRGSFERVDMTSNSSPRV